MVHKNFQFNKQEQYDVLTIHKWKKLVNIFSKNYLQTLIL